MMWKFRLWDQLIEMAGKWTRIENGDFPIAMLVDWREGGLNFSAVFLGRKHTPRKLWPFLGKSELPPCKMACFPPKRGSRCILFFLFVESFLVSSVYFRPFSGGVVCIQQYDQPVYLPNFTPDIYCTWCEVDGLWHYLLVVLNFNYLFICTPTWWDDQCRWSNSTIICFSNRAIKSP